MPRGVFVRTEAHKEKMRVSSSRHGLCYSRTYRSWRHMRSRCTNPNDASFKYHGARGITVCERWNKFENFLADMGERPSGTSLDRIDFNGNYEPGNCRWADAYTQATNRRPHGAQKAVA